VKFIPRICFTAAVIFTAGFSSVCAANDFSDENFISGVFLKDAWGPLWGETYGDGTLDAVKNSGNKWIGLHYFWSYSSTSTPVIESSWESDNFSSKAQKVAEFEAMIKKCKDRGYKVFIVPSINFGNILHGISGEEAVLNDCIYDVHNSTWYDNWFSGWENFMMEMGGIADRTGADLLSMGFHVGYAAEDGRDGYATTAAWRNLISNIRSAYPDLELTLLADSNGIESDNVSFCKFWDEFDYISVHLSGGVEHYAGTGTLTVPQIKDALNSMYSCVDLAGQSASSGKKVILVTAYSSSEFCFNGTWFEEFEPQPSISQDLTAQQNFYEAFFQSLSTHTWIAGTFPWGYWWKGTDYNENPGDAAFEKGPSHRGKPSEATIYSYYSKLTETLSVSTANFTSIKLIDGFNSVEVEIDTGTFDETVNIVVSTQSIIGFSSDYSSGTVNIVPSGLVITKTGSGQPSLPVSITISYSDSDLSDIASESALKLARYNAFGKWVILSSTAYPALNKVAGLTDHFSVFAKNTL